MSVCTTTIGGGYRARQPMLIVYTKICRNLQKDVCSPRMLLDTMRHGPLSRRFGYVANT